MEAIHMSNLFICYKDDMWRTVYGRYEDAFYFLTGCSALNMDRRSRISRSLDVACRIHDLCYTCGVAVSVSEKTCDNYFLELLDEISNEGLNSYTDDNYYEALVAICSAESMESLEITGADKAYNSLLNSCPEFCVEKSFLNTCIVNPL
ncbi:hypothetical protein ScPMuIL_001898 [Solemya velum]